MKNFLVLLMLSATLTFVAFEKQHFAYAQTPPVSEMAVDAAVVQPVPDVESNGIINTLKKLDEKIPLGIPGWLLLALTFGIELLMRFVPTAQPRSMLLLLALGLNLLASIFSKSSDLLDKLAQNVKTPVKK